MDLLIAIAGTASRICGGICSKFGLEIRRLSVAECTVNRYGLLGKGWGGIMLQSGRQIVAKSLCKKAAPFAIIFFASIMWVTAGQTDERWTSDFGTVIYQKDIGKWAIWTFGKKRNQVDGKIYIRGLAGVYKNRGEYKGYWTRSSGRRCHRKLRTVDGTAHSFYGSIIIKFLDPAFPSRWNAIVGRCDARPITRISGIPLIGGGVATNSQPIPRVPDVVGMTESAAESRYKVKVQISEQVPSDQPAGVIVWQKPRAGATMPRDRVVQVGIAQAKLPILWIVIVAGAAAIVAIAAWFKLKRSPPRLKMRKSNNCHFVAEKDCGTANVVSDETGVAGPAISIRFTKDLGVQTILSQE